MARILVVDDEPSMREYLEILLSRDGHDVLTAHNGRDALERFRASDDIDLVLSDVRMPEVDGRELARVVKRLRPDVQVVLLTAHGSQDDAVGAMNDDVFDYLTKPSSITEIQDVLGRALKKRKVLTDARRTDPKPAAAADPAGGRPIPGIIGKSQAMGPVFDTVRRVAPTRASVLILGESGTGKELVARAIHQLSDRAGERIITLNCGAVAKDLIESELFGYAKGGAFTGAAKEGRSGLFEAANRGTVFLDEIGELPLELQVKLLRVLQNRTVTRVGGTDEIPVDVRVIAATNRDLAEMVRLKSFREDLYFRLNVVTIRVPALRERRDDIPRLVHHFVDKFSEDMQRPQRAFTREAMEVLLAYDFPGNVRELQNVIERAVALSETSMIGLESLPASLMRTFRDPFANPEAIRYEPREDLPPPKALPGPAPGVYVGDPARRSSAEQRATAGHVRRVPTPPPFPVLSPGFEITTQDRLLHELEKVVDRIRLPRDVSADRPPFSLDRIMDHVEEKILRAVLRHTRFNRTEAAHLLQVTFRSVRYRLHKYPKIFADFGINLDHIRGEGETELEGDEN